MQEHRQRGRGKRYIHFQWYKNSLDKEVRLTDEKPMRAGVMDRGRGLYLNTVLLPVQFVSIFTLSVLSTAPTVAAILCPDSSH